VNHRLLVLALIGCGGESSAPTSGTPPASASVEASTKAAVDPGVWTPASVVNLRPVVPERLLKTRLPVELTDEIKRTMKRLEAVVQTHTANPDDPWAIGHGLLALGPEMTLPDGSPAVEHLFAHYAETFEADGNQLVRFPEKSDETLVQPHAELLLKALTESGVSPDRQVQVEGRSFSVADLYRGSLIQAYLQPEKNHSSFASTNDIPWALQALAAWAPDDLKWQALDGTQMDLDSLTDFGVVVMTKETQFLAEALAKREAFKKQRQGIYQYTCGGAHLIQGVGHALAQGFGGARGQELMTKQGPLQLFRMQVELEQLDAAVTAQPAVAFTLHAQRLKLTGHTLETLHKMSAAGQLAEDERTRKAMRWVANEVVESVRRLDVQKAFEQLPRIKEKDLQLYRDIVGDSSHALRGLMLATGAGTIQLSQTTP